MKMIMKKLSAYNAPFYVLFLSKVLCDGFETKSRVRLSCIRQANYKIPRHLKVRNVGDVDNIFV